ncbi:hypothetical protein ACQV2E_20920 [Pantoea allii]
MKKAGLSLLCPRRMCTPQKVASGIVKPTWRDKPMQFDPQIVSHAQAFVNARRNGKRARVPAMQVRQWPFFIALVNAGLGLA